MGFNNQRKAYGAALMDLGAEDPNVVVLDADLGNQPCPVNSRTNIRRGILKWESRKLT